MTMKINEGGVETTEKKKIQYVRRLTEHISPKLEKLVIALYKDCHEGEKRSEKKFLKTLSDREKEGACTIDDLCVVLGWYFGNEKDPSWRKVKDTFSSEQQDQIVFPEWVIRGEGSPKYDDEKYILFNGGIYGSDKDKRGY